ncbi:NAD-dependent succinate-semialdehyde dehydrogenase [Thaumasiovibrio sp. DFM-14]|uniref:NAD-dependent succinate-semialdehyde dehydrogenase n=1 Tax=Thaumasiovibrio sp. DFM-14 TaxID=3384792 RepID=UPI0039A1BF10
MDKVKNAPLLNCLLDNEVDGLAVTNPATGELIGHVPCATPEDVNTAIEQAAVAQKAWQQRSAEQRAEILLRWYQLLMSNKEDLARILTLEQGKPLSESRGEVAYGASFVQWFAEEAKRAYGRSIPAPANDRRIITIKQPVGVAAAITPWNFPIAMITRKAAPALAAGCAFVCKPAEATPLSAFAVAELAYQAGIPKELLSIIVSTNPAEVGEVLCQSETVRKLSFTGSTQVGRKLIAQCAATVKRTSMELGGNAPFIVLADADIPKAVEGAVKSKFRNAGQTCVCANRFYVHDSVYDEFIEQYKRAVATLVVGNGLNLDTDIGPLINAAAKEKVEQLIASTLDAGATLITGGKSLSGLFIQPTILGDVTQSMPIVKEEIFGPVAPVIRFSDTNALLTMANDSIFGLAAYFYGNNMAEIWHIAEALEFGMVGINEGIISSAVAPFGGVKQSGYGREGAQEGLDEYLDTKYLCFGGLE